MSLPLVLYGHSRWGVWVGRVPGRGYTVIVYAFELKSGVELVNLGGDSWGDLGECRQPIAISAHRMYAPSGSGYHPQNAWV